jgi:hypothetical protein
LDPKTCPKCGAAIEADHPQGLCPACLLKEGLQEMALSKGGPAIEAMATVDRHLTPPRPATNLGLLAADARVRVSPCPS